MSLTASDVASLTRTIERWEFAEYIFAGLVTVACFGEYVADFTKWWMRGGLWNFLGPPDERKERLGKLSTLLLIGALALELVCLVKTNHLSGQMLGSLDERSEEAVKKSVKALEDSNAAIKQAGSAGWAASSALSLTKDARKEVATFAREIVAAKEQAARAESHLAEALERAARAETGVTKVREAQAARRLTEPQKRELITELSKVPPFKVDFFPVASSATREVMDFGNDLVEVFVRMKVLPPESKFGGVIALASAGVRGVVIAVRSQQEYPPAAIVLQTKLIEYGFEAHAEGPPTAPGPYEPPKAIPPPPPPPPLTPEQDQKLNPMQRKRRASQLARSRGGPTIPPQNPNVLAPDQMRIAVGSKQ
jgi:hypothetical protein